MLNGARLSMHCRHKVQMQTKVSGVYPCFFWTCVILLVTPNWGTRHAFKLPLFFFCLFSSSVLFLLLSLFLFCFSYCSVSVLLLSLIFLMPHVFTRLGCKVEVEVMRSVATRQLLHYCMLLTCTHTYTHTRIHTYAGRVRGCVCCPNPGPASLHTNAHMCTHTHTHTHLYTHSCTRAHM